MVNYYYNKHQNVSASVSARIHQQHISTVDNVTLEDEP